MNTDVTRLEIGLSREDQERIEALRQVDLDKAEKKINFFVRLNDIVVGWTKISLREKVTFYQLLATMINAGMPIIRSLYVLSDQMNNLKLKRVIRELALEMEEGKSLSVAMERFDSVFSSAERGMITSGEASGNLNEILKDIAKQAEKSAAIISKVKGAMIYPASILLIMFACLYLILTLVVPKLTELFTAGGKELPLNTQILLKASDIAQNSWEFVLVFIALAVAGLYFMRRSKQGRYTIDMALLYMPLFGKLLRELMVARFSRLLASLISSGVPIVHALEIDANALGNEVYKRRVQFAAQDVSQGIPLGENLNGTPFLFPPMVASMVLVGEQTAKINEIASKIADYYEEEVDTAVASLSKLMEPLILVVMGLMVGFIVSAIMMPIISLTDFVGSI
jgi:type IV pilus assembly protein PilC